MNQTFSRYASPTFQSLCHFLTPSCRRYQEGKSFKIRIAIKCKSDVMEMMQHMELLLSSQGLKNNNS